MKDFPIYGEESQLTYLAYYIEQLARHLLGLRFIPPEEWLVHRGANHFDIEDAHLRSFIEVKGMSNNDQLKLFEDQLQSQLKELGFPIDDGLLWIISYKNLSGKRTSRSKKTGKLYRPRLLKAMGGKTWNELSQFLAEHISEAIAVDMRLLELLYRQNGTLDYTRDKFNLRKRVSISRTALKRLAKNARTSLVELGTPPEEISRWLPPNANRFLPRIIKTKFDGREVSFKLFMLTPNGFKNRFLRRLNGDIKRSKSA